MSHATIQITDGDRNVIKGVSAGNMQRALADATADAMYLVGQRGPTLYLRDALGGLRREVRLRDGVVTVVKTP